MDASGTMKTFRGLSSSRMLIGLVASVLAILAIGSLVSASDPGQTATEDIGGAASGRLVVATTAKATGWIQHRLVLLDENGKTLRLGPREGLINALAACPGARYFLEVEQRESWWHSRLHVRHAKTLKLVRSIRLPPQGFFGAMRCMDSSARRAAVFISQDASTDDRSRLLLVNGRQLRTIHRGRFSDAVLSHREAFVFRTYSALREVTAVDLRNGRTRVAARMSRRPQSVAVSPDGRTLAAIIQKPHPRDNPFAGSSSPTLHIFDIRTGIRHAVIRLRAFPFPIGMFDRGFQERPDPAPPCPPQCASGQAVWLSHQLVAFVPSVSPGSDTDVFSLDGRRQGRLPGFYGAYPVVLGSWMYAVARDPTVDDPDVAPYLRRVPLTGGPAERVRVLEQPSPLAEDPHELIAFSK